MHYKGEVSWQPGATIGPYLLEARLGVGGMGEVWRARHLQTGAPRALKVLREPDPDLHARFRREGEAMARIDHPSVVRVHEFFALGPELILALELAEGGTLSERLRAGPLDPAEAARILTQLAHGVAQVHAAGALHRDIKPDNVLFGAGGEAKLGDFGLTRLRESEEALTRTGEILGTPAYMAPEQALSGACDERTDVYGLGALLYHCLTGEPPFSGGSTLALLDAVCNRAPAAPRERAAAVPDWLSRLCLQALAKDPARRPMSAEAFADALARQQAPSRSAAPWLAAAALLGLATFAGLYAALPGQPQPTPTPTPSALAQLPAPPPPSLGPSWRPWELVEREWTAALPFATWDGPGALLLATRREGRGVLERWSPAGSAAGALQRSPLASFEFAPSHDPLCLLQRVGADVVWAHPARAPVLLRPNARPAPWRAPLRPGERVEAAARWGEERLVLVVAGPAGARRVPPTRLLALEAATGAELRSVALERRCEHLREVAAEPGGERVALAFSDAGQPIGGLHLVHLGEQVRAQRVNFPSPRSLCWRGAELLIVSNVRQRVLRLDPSQPLRAGASREVLYTAERLGGQVRRIAATASGRVVVSVISEGVSLQLFEPGSDRPTTLRPPSQMQEEPHPYPLLRLSPDGRHAAVVAPRFLWVTPLPRE